MPTSARLKIHARRKEGIPILVLQGRLIFGEAQGLSEALAACLAQGDVKVILNGQSIREVDWDSLGELIVWSDRLREPGGAIKLVHFNRNQLDLGLLVRLETVFEVFSDEQDAVNSFFPHRTIRRFDILEFVNEQEPPAAEIPA